jgi:hypothetical protein
LEKTHCTYLRYFLEALKGYILRNWHFVAWSSRFLLCGEWVGTSAVQSQERNNLQVRERACKTRQKSKLQLLLGIANSQIAHPDKLNFGSEWSQPNFSGKGRNIESTYAEDASVFFARAKTCWDRGASKGRKEVEDNSTQGFVRGWP